MLPPIVSEGSVIQINSRNSFFPTWESYQNSTLSSCACDCEINRPVNNNQSLVTISLDLLIPSDTHVDSIVESPCPSETDDPVGFSTRQYVLHELGTMLRVYDATDPAGRSALQALITDVLTGKFFLFRNKKRKKWRKTILVELGCWSGYHLASDSILMQSSVGRTLRRRHSNKKR